MLRKFRRIRLKWIAITCAAVVAVLAGFLWITNLFIPLPYDQVQIEADIQEPETEVIDFGRRYKPDGNIRRSPGCGKGRDVWVQ